MRMFSFNASTNNYARQSRIRHKLNFYVVIASLLGLETNHLEFVDFTRTMMYMGQQHAYAFQMIWSCDVLEKSGLGIKNTLKQSKILFCYYLNTTVSTEESKRELC